MEFDALIIGGGIIGMTSAMQLKQADLRVAIIDKGELGKEASWAAGGILSALYPWQQNKDCSALIQRSQKLFPDFVKELIQHTKIDPQLIQSGMIILDSNMQQADHCLSKNNEVSESIAQEQLKKFEPYINPNIDSALYLPNIMQIRPPYLIQALKTYLNLIGVSIFEHEKVENLIIQSKTVQGVETENNKLFADKVIVCNGAWAGELLHQVTTNNTDVQPVRGQMLLYPHQQNKIKHIIISQGRYIIPREDGQVLCGSTVEHVGFNRETTSHAAVELHQFAQTLFPHLAQHAASHHWAALRPGTQRIAPYICEHPEISDLYCNTGHFRYGILMSLASAEILATLIKNKLPASQTDRYAY